MSLLANVLSKQEASKHQAREAWLYENGDEFSEGSVSNAYIVTKSGEIVTHQADEKILGGVTGSADVVLKLAKKAEHENGRAADSTALKWSRRRKAFLTSTSANVLPVVKIDDAPVGNGKVGPIVRKLQ